ncbi:hypothetical protein EVAR_20771_1 [Eumeta japonica]|uniref:Uncharacterized protein n=1 Tax=Eumeta variegata TaxID=151549 RepID=A0A4C1UEA7_EUMVA|nr:hypothetical protein EVAR_20771_1 [Eumeta japonica]
MMSVYSLTTPLDLRLARELFKFGSLKWGHHHWTVEDVSPTRRRPGMRQHKSSVPQEKGCGRSANERLDDSTSVPGSRTGPQHGTYSAPHHKGRGSKPSKTSLYG